MDGAAMSSNRRCLDEHGLVHYADWSGQKREGIPLWRSWCHFAVAPEAVPKRAKVTCLLCLWVRWRQRGGDGALLGPR